MSPFVLQQLVAHFSGTKRNNFGSSHAVGRFKLCQSGCLGSNWVTRSLSHCIQLAVPIYEFSAFLIMIDILKCFFDQLYNAYLLFLLNTCLLPDSVLCRFPPTQAEGSSSLAPSLVVHIDTGVSFIAHTETANLQPPR